MPKRRRRPISALRVGLDHAETREGRDHCRLAYFVLPTDAIPDFVAVLGYTDDATVFWAVWRLIGHHVTADHRARVRVLLDPDGL